MADSRVRFILPFAILVAILAVSTASIFIRFALEDGVPALVIAALRLTFATLMLAPVALTKHRAELQKLSRETILLGILSGVFLSIHFATWITSLEYTSVASSVVFVSTGPLWVALLSPMLLNERLARTALIGVGFALLGGTVIGLSDACAWSQSGLSCPALTEVMQGRAMWGNPARLLDIQGSVRGNFLALVGAWTVTGYLIIGRKVRANMSLIPYIFLVYGMAAVMLVVFMFIAGDSPLGYAPISYGWVFLLAAIPQLIGHSTYNWALKYMPAALVAVVTLGEPIGSAILAFFILNEIPARMVIFGGILILTGIYLVSRRNQT